MKKKMIPIISFLMASCLLIYGSVPTCAQAVGNSSGSTAEVYISTSAENAPEKVLTLLEEYDVNYNSNSKV